MAEVARYLDAHLRVTKDGRVVDLHLAVGAHQLAVRCQDQGVDLEGETVVLPVGARETRADRRQRHEELVRDIRPDQQVHDLIHVEVPQGRDVQALDGLVGHALDVHAALAAEHEQRASAAARGIDDDADVELAGDIEPFLHQHCGDREALDLRAQEC